MVDIDSISKQAIADVSQVEAAFEDLSLYNQTLGFTHMRTVGDVARYTDTNDILEIGFFTGAVSLALARLRYDVTASDIPFVANDNALRAFLEKESITVVPWDLSDQTAPFAAKSFDLIVFTEVIEHLPFNCIPLLREFHRILRPGGRVYCATPNLGYVKTRLKLALGRDIGNPVSHLIAGLTPGTGVSVGLHWREHTKQSLIDLFEAAGFTCESHRYISMDPVESVFPKNVLKSALFKMSPAMLPGQVGVFRA